QILDLRAYGWTDEKAEGLAIVDDSKSANVFGRVQVQLTEQIPTDAPGWFIAQYDKLMANAECVPPARPVAPVTAPADAAPADAAPADGTAPATGSGN
ncbi:MAG: hypothetical protein ABI459_09360, partial [Deltaproteobacteria bacterium]